MPTMPLRLRRYFPMLIVTGADHESSALAQRSQALVETISQANFPVELVHGLAAGAAHIAATPQVSCVVLGLDQDTKDFKGLRTIVDAARRHSEALPVFIATAHKAIGSVPLELLKKTEGFIWLFEDTPHFIAGRIVAAARRYLDTVLPPFFGALANFNKVNEYSWHTPGHAGGTAFRKTACGSAFWSFYGEQMLRSDLSISVGELGSLNDHSGPVGDAEAFAAKTFGADYTVFSVGGSSASNQMVLHAFVRDGDIVLVDRNCHKSLNYALIMSGAIPVYLIPKRNSRGVIGPVPLVEMSAEAVKAKIHASPLVKDKTKKPALAVLTNSTYDGLCYDIDAAGPALGQSADRIHYDEAWYGYARFNKLYAGRFAMHGYGMPNDLTQPTVTATQSTHKLLAALSQASMIHVRKGRAEFKPALFNEAFMMHTSTSPQYSIIASTDVSTKMMHDAGPTLTEDCIREAVDFRQEIGRIGREFSSKNKDDWWFETWQPKTVGGMDFIDCDPALLVGDKKAWLLSPDDDWHGFGDLGSDGYCMLDPIKVTLLTPGISVKGKLEKTGIPAAIVSAFLDEIGIIVEKTEPYSILTLFSVGITKGKWGSLVSGLLDFKEAYDSDAPISEALPKLFAAHPKDYENVGLKKLSAEMHKFLADIKLLENLDAAFQNLPEAAMTPRDAHNKLVRGDVERLPISEKLIGRVVAVQLVPYPPGIPVVMPGEKITNESKATIGYLKALEKFDRKFSGFEHETHGIEVDYDPDGKPVYFTYVFPDDRS